MCGIGEFVYHYQTLLGSILALGAAYYAGRPVYKQLELSQTQANGVLREMLLSRQAEMLAAQVAVKKHVQKPVGEVYDAPYWEEGRLISPEQAFHDSDRMEAALGWLQSEYQWRDSKAVQEAKAVLIKSLEDLGSALHDAHLPDSSNQEWVDEAGIDREIPADKWEEIVRRSAEAKGEISGLRSHALRDTRAMLSAITNDFQEIGKRLSQVDAALLGRV